MNRRKLILLVVVAALLVGLYLAGVALGARTPEDVSVDDWRRRLGARALAPVELADAGNCVDGHMVKVAPGRPCVLTVDSTWSLRRRVLLLEPTAGALKARVVPREHRERRVEASLEVGANELPVDRAGASIVVTCQGAPLCTAAIR